MARTLSVLVVALTLGVRALGAQDALPRATDRRAVALRIVELETRRQEATGSLATIDSLLALYADSVVYEHPNAGAVVRGKAALRQGMPQYIGSIRHVTATPPRVTVGNRVAVVETSTSMEVLDGATWAPVSRHGIRVIEFDAHGLVHRILDYPW